MATIVTRAGKGAPLTNAEVDANFTNLNTGLTSSVAITGGTINGTPIGGTTRAAGSFTTLDANGNVTLGDATSDTITATGRFNTDLVPSTDNARDIGTSALKWKQVYATTFTEGTFPVVSQTDIGSAPNQIPLNQYLGALAYQGNNVITYLQQQINTLQFAVYNLLPVSANYVDMRDSLFIGLGKQPVGVAINSTNGGNNTNWNFV